VAAAAGYILMTDVTNLIPLLTKFVSMREQHVWGMRKIVAYAIVTKSNAVTLQTFSLLRLSDRLMIDGPTEARMGSWRRTDNNWRFDQNVFTFAHNRDGVAQVAAGRNCGHFLAWITYTDVFIIMAAKTAQ